MVKKDQAAAVDSAGFLFINATSDSTPRRGHQRQVKSHVSRGRPRKRPCRQVTTWMTGEDRTTEATCQASKQMLLGPRKVDLELSLAGLPDGLRLEMVHTAVRFLAGVNKALYPEEICLPVEPQGSPWIEHLMTDSTYLHAILYASECYGNILLGRDQESKETQFHLLKTLQLLRGRISNSGDPLAVANQTIMTVVVLAFASEVLGESSVLVNHLEGLTRMVGLRGGFGRVGVESDMLAAKICRVDLSAALRFDHRPMFFTREISWDCYFDAHSAPDQRDGLPIATTDVNTFVQSLDWRLSNVWEDARHFSYLSSLACSTGYKLAHELYSDFMASILYRLLHMAPDPDCMAGTALRLALIALGSNMFLRWQGLKTDYDGSLKRFGDALEALRGSDDLETVPAPLLLWMLLLRHALQQPGKTPSHDTRWLPEVIGRLGLSSWEGARQIVKTMVWIDFLHDAKGKAAFSLALLADE